MKTDSRQKNTSIFLKSSVAIICAAIASGCAVDPKTGQPSFKETFASDDPCSNNARNIGIGLGALAGAIIGNQVNHSNKGLLLGAALGASVGGLIGYDMDRRRCDLSKIAKQYNLDIRVSTVSAAGEVIDDKTLRSNANPAAIKNSALGSVVEVSDQSFTGGHFETNSDKLTAKAQQYFAAIADSYNTAKTADHIPDPKARADYIAKNANRKILLIGHTDDTGSSELNAELSERRAKVVSRFMEERGIPRASLYFQGAGEFYPITSNATEEGRSKNRRVEIIEVADTDAFDKYLAARKPHYEYYRSNSEIGSIAGNQQHIKEPSPQNTSKQRNQKTAASGKNIAGTAAAAAPSAAAPSQTTTVKPVNSSPQSTKAIAMPAATIDFGGVPLTSDAAATDIGKREPKRALFSLISTAYADEPAVISDCTQDRPRAAKGVKALSDGKTYRTSEYIPGLYGKTWTDQVNGHQIVMNKIAVLANDGSLANPPEFKIYTNYDDTKNPNPIPALVMKPDVNTYLGSKGVLYRLFINGQAGMECVDVVFAADGSRLAKAGKLVYTHAAKRYVADFKPKMY